MQIIKNILVSELKLNMCHTIQCVFLDSCIYFTHTKAARWSSQSCHLSDRWLQDCFDWTEFACSPHAPVGFLQVLQFAPMDHKIPVKEVGCHFHLLKIMNKANDSKARVTTF